MLGRAPSSRPPGLQRLGIAVLTCALQDACENTRRGEQARGWLRSRGEGLTLWCAAAGVAERHVLRTLDRIEAAGLGAAARQALRGLPALAHAADKATDDDIDMSIEGAA